MKKTIQIFRQKNSNISNDQVGTFFSKVFSIDDNSGQTIIVHEDFPMITEDDIDAFIHHCRGSEKIVVSGRNVEPHPYRLLFIDQEGFFKPVVKIPQSIRGNRHFYPDVYQVVPALLFLPEGTTIKDLIEMSMPDIFLLEKDKLLDKTCFPDSLFLTRMKGF